MRRSNPFFLVFLTCGLSAPPASARNLGGVAGEAASTIGGAGSAASVGAAGTASQSSGINLSLPGSSLPLGTAPGVMGPQFSPNVSVNPQVQPTASADVNANSGVTAANTGAQGVSSADATRAGTGVAGRTVSTTGGRRMVDSYDASRQAPTSMQGAGAVRTPTGGADNETAGRPAETGVRSVDAVGGEFRKAKALEAEGAEGAVADTSEKLFTGGESRNAGSVSGAAATSVSGDLGMDAAAQAEFKLKAAVDAAESPALITQAQAPAFIVQGLELARAGNDQAGEAKFLAEARRRATPAKLSEFGDAALAAAASGKAGDKELFERAVRNYNQALTANPAEPHIERLSEFTGAVERTVRARLDAKGKGVKAPTVKFTPMAGSAGVRVTTVVDMPADMAAAVKPVAASLAADMALPEIVRAPDAVLDAPVPNAAVLAEELLPPSQEGFFGRVRQRQSEGQSFFGAFLGSLFDLAAARAQSFWLKLRSLVLSFFYEESRGFAVASTEDALAPLRAAEARPAALPAPRAPLAEVLGLRYRLQPVAP